MTKEISDDVARHHRNLTSAKVTSNCTHVGDLCVLAINYRHSVDKEYPITLALGKDKDAALEYPIKVAVKTY